MRAYNDVEAELLAEIRQLALDMLRFDAWMRLVAQRGHFEQVAELDTQRELACRRRSELMRELWAGRQVVLR